MYLKLVLLLVEPKILLEESIFLRNFHIQKSETIRKFLCLKFRKQRIQVQTDKKQLMDLLSISSKVILMSSFFLNSSFTLAFQGVFTILAKDEIKKKLTERIYEYWKNLSPNTKTTICVISGTAGGVIALGLIISWGNIETLRGGVSPQLIHRPPSKLISSGLNSRFCREVLAYTLTKVNLPENFVIPDKIDTILLDSTIENLNQLLESNQEIKFINTSVLFELLKMCEKFFTDD